MIVIRLIFRRSPGSSEQGTRSQQREEIRFGGNTHYVVRFAASAQVHRVSPADERHVLKAVILRFPVQKIRPCERIVARRRLSFVQADQLPRLLIGQGTQ